jgi:hypothetical protein
MIPPAEEKCLRNWLKANRKFEEDPDLDLVRCLRIVSERLLPGMVTPIDLEQHKKQTGFDEVDDKCCRCWEHGIPTILQSQDRVMSWRFVTISENVLKEMGFVSMLESEWVNPLKLVASWFTVIAGYPEGREILRSRVFRDRFTLVPATDPEVLDLLGNDPNLYRPDPRTPLHASDSDEMLIAEACVTMADNQRGREILRSHLLTVTLPLWDTDETSSNASDSDWPGIEDPAPTEDLSDLEDCPALSSAGPATIVEPTARESILENHHSLSSHTTRTPGFFSRTFFLLAIAAIQEFIPPGLVVSRIRTHGEDTRYCTELRRSEEVRPEPDPVPDFFPGLVVSDAELDISRRVLEGEITLDEGMALLVRMMGSTTL